MSSCVPWSTNMMSGLGLGSAILRFGEQVVVADDVSLQTIWLQILKLLMVRDVSYCHEKGFVVLSLSMVC